MSGIELMALAASAAQVAGSVVRGVSAYNTSRTQAALAEREGEAARARGQVEQDIALIEGERVIGQARAAAGASGFDLSGSPSEIFARLAAERSATARTAIYEGEAARDAAMVEARQIRAAGKAELFGSLLEAGGQAVAGAQSFKAARVEAWGAKARARIPGPMAPAPRVSLTTRANPIRLGGG
jgi:hypothetical protein